MTDAHAILSEIGFGPTYFVQGRASVADLFNPGKRCGIYVLHFATGEYYVGQAIDVTRRYVQHCRNHTDIQRINFKPVRADLLNEIERATIEAFERRGFELRNIALTSIPKGESDFDLVLSDRDQTIWLNNPDVFHLEGSRPVDPDLRRKYARHYARLMGKPAAEEAILVLREYVRTGIPACRAGEISFWSCSCLPQGSNREIAVYSRINVYWQEVFTAFLSNGDLRFSWHIARSPLEHAFGKPLRRLMKSYPDVEIFDHRYAPGGQDQINLEARGAATALKLLKDTTILYATRLFNLRLMKKGPCAFGRYHCMSLADRLID